MYLEAARLDAGVEHPGARGAPGRAHRVGVFGRREREDAAATAEQEAVAALEDAANKEVTPDVRDAVNKLLDGKIVVSAPAG